MLEGTFLQISVADAPETESAIEIILLLFIFAHWWVLRDAGHSSRAV
jgi:hypothetical protein